MMLEVLVVSQESILQFDFFYVIKDFIIKLTVKNKGKLIMMISIIVSDYNAFSWGLCYKN